MTDDSAANRWRDFIAAAVLALAAAAASALVVLGWRYPHGELDSGAVMGVSLLALGVITMSESIGGKLFKDAQRGAWLHSPVRTPDGMRPGLRLRPRTHAWLVRWGALTFAGAVACLCLGASFARGDWLGMIGSAALLVTGGAKYGAQARHELRYRSQIVLTDRGMGLHNRFLPWAQVSSLKWDVDSGHPIVRDHSGGKWPIKTGRLWRDSEIGRVILHYLEHPTDRRLLEFASHAVPPRLAD